MSEINGEIESSNSENMKKMIIDVSMNSLKAYKISKDNVFEFAFNDPKNSDHCAFMVVETFCRGSYLSSEKLLNPASSSSEFLAYVIIGREIDSSIIKTIHISTKEYNHLKNFKGVVQSVCFSETGNFLSVTDSFGTLYVYSVIFDNGSVRTDLISSKECFDSSDFYHSTFWCYSEDSYITHLSLWRSDGSVRLFKFDSLTNSDSSTDPQQSECLSFDLQPDEIVINCYFVEGPRFIIASISSGYLKVFRMEENNSISFLSSISLFDGSPVLGINVIKYSIEDKKCIFLVANSKNRIKVISFESFETRQSIQLPESCNLLACDAKKSSEFFYTDSSSKALLYFQANENTNDGLTLETFSCFPLITKTISLILDDSNEKESEKRLFEYHQGGLRRLTVSTKTAAVENNKAGDPLVNGEKATEKNKIETFLNEIVKEKRILKNNTDSVGFVPPNNQVFKINGSRGGVKSSSEDDGNSSGDEQEEPLTSSFNSRKLKNCIDSIGLIKQKKPFTDKPTKFAESRDKEAGSPLPKKINTKIESQSVVEILGSRFDELKRFLENNLNEKGIEIKNIHTRLQSVERNQIAERNSIENIKGLIGSLNKTTSVIKASLSKLELVNQNVYANSIKDLISNDDFTKPLLAKIESTLNSAITNKMGPVVYASLFPAFEANFKKLFQTVNDTFQKGTSEYLVSVESHLSKFESLFSESPNSPDKSSSLILQKQEDRLTGIITRCVSDIVNKANDTIINSLKTSLLLAIRSELNGVLNKKESQMVNPIRYKEKIEELLGEKKPWNALEMSLESQDAQVLLFFMCQMSASDLFDGSRQDQIPLNQILLLLRSIRSEMINSDSAVVFEYIEEALVYLQSVEPDNQAKKSISDSVSSVIVQLEMAKLRADKASIKKITSLGLMCQACMNRS